ncbi:hypothetical protein VNO77_44110 [Canavalia gladiata]|uniref:Protein SDA1 n=1 Tax=Canavalia gladiata TaxID=3824 RepID=A0AAN9PQ27_CANGL
MGSSGAGASEPLSASDQSSQKLSLSSLQSKMKCDLVDMNFTSITDIAPDPTVANDLAERTLFLAHVTPFYPKHLANFPHKLVNLLRGAARKLPSGLRCHLAKALILLVNQKLQTLGEKTLRKLAFDHVVHSIQRMNEKHKDEAKNQALQKVLFDMLERENKELAKKVLVTLCELHRRKVWFDKRTANEICTASYKKDSRIMKAALSFLLDYEKIENDDDNDELTESTQVVLSREAFHMM